MQRVYGCGFKYGSEDMLDEFYEGDVVCIGHSFKEASSLYVLMAEVEVGDIIFLKVSNYKTGLKVHLVGMVTKAPCIQNRYNGDGDLLGTGIEVEWKDTGDRELKLGKGRDKYDNVRHGTFYREINPRFIHRIKRLYCDK